jgi:hypothetical protein
MWLPPVPLLPLGVGCSVMYFLCFTALAVLCTQAMAAANSRWARKTQQLVAAAG